MDKDKNILLGERIRALRNKQKLTQQELAKKLQITPKYLQFIENGSRTPSLDTVYRIAEVLEIEVKDIFNFTLGDKNK